MAPTAAEVSQRVDALEREFVAQRTELAAFRSRVDTLVGLARFGAGALVAIFVAALTLGTWAVYGAGRIEAEVKELRTSVGRIDSELKDLNTKVGRIDSDLKVLTSKVARIDSDVKGVVAAVSAVDGKVDRLSGRIDGLDRGVKDGFGELRSLIREQAKPRP